MKLIAQLSELFGSFASSPEQISALRRQINPIKVILLLAVLIIVNCHGKLTAGQQFKSEKTQTDNLLSIFYFAEMDKRRRCELHIDERIAPSDTEKQNYILRLDSKTDLIYHPIDVDCLSHQYKFSSLESWAKKGDPVAEYVSVYVKIKNGFDICRNLGVVVPELIKYYNVSSKIKTFTPCIISSAGDINAKKEVCRTDIKRVPELYYLVLSTKEVCNQSHSWPPIYELELHGLSHKLFPLIGVE